MRLRNIKRRDFVKTLAAGAGGVSAASLFAALASAYHIPVSPHGDPWSSAQLLASTPNTLIMETYPGVKAFAKKALKLFKVKDGFIEVSETPGVGMDPDPDIVKKYRVG